MKSILEIDVSCFQNYRETQNPKTVTLLQWVTSKKYSEQVNEIRKMNNKGEIDKIKATLPAITPSGLFRQRKANALIQHSGFIQFDIDFKENTHITNYKDLKSQLSKIINIAYCGLSVSGTGYWGLIPIAFPKKHKSHFEALAEDFRQLGIVLDDKPKSIASLRGYSYDDTAYFNHQAATYNRLKKVKPKALPRQKVRHPRHTNKTQLSTKEQVQHLVNEICRQSIDLTSEYDDWFALGSSLASEFRESGRDLFHQISQFHPEYNPRQTNYQYDHCLKSNRYSIASFFHFCQQANIYTKPIPPNPLPSSKHPTEKFSRFDGIIISNEINEYGYPAFWDN